MRIKFKYITKMMNLPFKSKTLLSSFVKTYNQSSMRIYVEFTKLFNFNLLYYLPFISNSTLTKFRIYFITSLESIIHWCGRGLKFLIMGQTPPPPMKIEDIDSTFVAYTTKKLSSLFSLSLISTFFPCINPMI